MQNRNLIDVIRVRYWYEGLRQRTGYNTAYKLEQKFEPLTKNNADDRTSPRHKWNRYKTGKHTPTKASLLEKVEKACPGSTRELRHPLWEVFKQGDDCADNLDNWLLKLNPSIQAVVFKCMPKGCFGIPVRKNFNQTVARKLIYLAGLDALTALILY